MAHKFSIPAEAVPIGNLLPAADAAGRTGPYRDISGYHKIFAEFFINQGNAATIALSLSRATSGAGAGATAVVETFPIYHNQDSQNGVDFTRVADAASFTTSAATTGKIVIVEIDPAKLPDTFAFLALVTGASNAANITSGKLWGVPRYAKI